jgi:D-alanine-D-alanine ligase
MRIGLTYDLRDDYRDRGLSEEALAEFDTPETIGEIEGALQRLGHAVERIGHVRALAAALVAGRRWDLVFNICEGLSGRSREAQVPALLEAFDQPYTFADPLTQAVTLDKAVAKRLVRDAGLPTAPFAVLESEEDARACDLPFPVFVKPLAEGTGKGCERASKVRDRAELAEAARSIRNRFRQAALAEAFLPGREFTIGLVGNGDDVRVIAVMEITLLNASDEAIYSFESKELCESRVAYTLADDAEAREAAEIAVKAYRLLGCRDAARLDFRSDAESRPHFLEANPLAGLHPQHSDLPMLAQKAGMSYDALLDAIVRAAAGRQGVARVAEAA